MSGAACFGDVCGGHHSPAAVGADSVGPGTIQLWIIGRIRYDVHRACQVAYVAFGNTGNTAERC